MTINGRKGAIPNMTRIDLSLKKIFLCGENITIKIVLGSANQYSIISLKMARKKLSNSNLAPCINKYLL